MNYICIGKIVNTHGIKGELRIISDFPYKKEIYSQGNHLYVGCEKTKFMLNTYRHHKIFDMVTFDGINDINDVIKYKGEFIYFDRDEVKLPGLIDSDYIGLSVYNGNAYIGDVTSIMKSKPNDILVIEKENSRNLIPNIPVFIKSIDLYKKCIYIESIEGLINEN